MSVVVLTGDGSFTFFNEPTGEHYHSLHGAVAESRHVFVEAGLEHLLNREHETVRVLEAGFGTGLNFLLSADLCSEKKIRLDYSAVEAFPLGQDQLIQTNYGRYIEPVLWEAFLKQYAPETREIILNDFCSLHLIISRIEEFSASRHFHLIYYDAFSATHQPELWEPEVIRRYADLLEPGGVFVTYSITGNLKRMFRSLGFHIERLPGAPGKREMLRATKPVRK